MVSPHLLRDVIVWWVEQPAVRVSCNEVRVSWAFVVRGALIVLVCDEVRLFAGQLIAPNHAALLEHSAVVIPEYANHSVPCHLHGYLRAIESSGTCP